jgi:membrane-bound ClpP family serine protease
LFLPILWILWHRLWLTLIGYIIFVLLIAWTGRLATEQIATILAILGAILFALEANNVRRLSLARRGWRRWWAVRAGH